MGTIDWAGPNWEASATMLAGVAAVIGAVIVGRRQAGIADRQADIMAKQTAILGRQVELQQVETLNLLYDRRLVVYQTCSDLLRGIFNKHDVLFHDNLAKMTMVSMDAQFIFEKGIADLVTEVHKIGVKHRDTGLRILASRASEDEKDMLRKEVTDRAEDLYLQVYERFLLVMAFPKI